MPIFFESKGEIPFDFFSAAFYLVSRYEEYLPHQTDKHDRFKATESLAYKNGFLRKPLVNLWANQLIEILQSQFQWKFEERRHFKHTPTIDVDSAYAYQAKGFLRTVGGATKDLVRFNFQNLILRLRVVLGLEKDPFDVFDWLTQLYEEFDLRPVYFFQVGELGFYDKNVSITNNRFRKLIKLVNDVAQVGLHPSYASSSSAKILQEELKNLSKTLHQPIVKSRNHYIKIKFPSTYQRLIESEIQEDYTMGYASQLGFRASICNSFFWYDLDSESKTPLRVYPFAIMEATCKFYQSLSVSEILNEFIPIIETVKEVRGELISVWHNESLAELESWQGYKSVYRELLEFCAKP